MTLAMELSPDEEVRLIAAARREGLAPGELARRLVVAHLPPITANGGEQEAAGAEAKRAADTASEAADGEDELNWEAWTSVPPRRRTGTIRAKLQHSGRAGPMPADDPWAK